MDEEIGQFMAITGVESERVARGYLEISGNNAMQAVQTFFDNPDLQSSFASAPSEPSTAARRPAPTSSRNRAGREDAEGVIHLDSDEEEEDVSMIDDLDDPFGTPHDAIESVTAVARNAQEEEDAAMARRLQEDFYGSGGGGPGGIPGDEVRAPIERRTETLMAPDPSWGPMQAERDAIMEELRTRRQQPRRNPNPFHQAPSVWDSPSTPPVPMATRPGGQPTSRAAMLADLFRPPHDLIGHFSWDEARQSGKDEKKWILVNLQNLSIFQCQALNRDVWKDERIKSLVREHFIFLQYDKQDPMAESYVTFYFPNDASDNPDIYPHVSIIDPRTGEQVKVWSGDPFPTANDFYTDLIEFLDRYSLAANSKNPVAKSKPKAKPVDVGRMTEEQMLEMAMQASLEASNGGRSGGESGSSSAPAIEDPDALTKSNPDIGKGKGRAIDEVMGPEDDNIETPLSPSTTRASAFAQISSTSPHTEPEDPRTTTRIQFRTSGGRVIRRFALTDTVRRIYEWLKAEEAEPMKGKENVSFELKGMPAGRDLVEDLDKTIEEAGLKNGTVLIEFIED